MNVTEDDIAKILQIGALVGQVVKDDAMGKWAQLEIPRLNNATPMQFIQSGDLDRLIQLGREYSDGVYV